MTREVEHYNLEMVLALGFGVRSPVGVRFRQWANDKPNLSFRRDASKAARPLTSIRYHGTASYSCAVAASL